MHHDVEVHVQVHARAESSYVRYRSGRRVANTDSLRPLAVAPVDRLDEDAHERREDVGSEGRKRTQLEGKREHPLPHRHGRKHAVDQVGSDVRHAAPGATRAHAATEARERNEQIVAASVATRANEAVREPPAAEVAAELLLDVAR